jgi:hypothetical protein
VVVVVAVGDLLLRVLATGIVVVVFDILLASLLKSLFEAALDKSPLHVVGVVESDLFAFPDS